MKTAVKIFLSLLLLQISCVSQKLNHSLNTKFGKFRYSDYDLISINDLVKTCNNYLPAIASELNLKINDSVIIEIYPNQPDYNNNIMNKDFINSPAISGNGIIQMVSPKAKIKIDTIKYNDRLLFLVHEYIHILIDQLDKQPPIFIDEGIASYFSSYSFYKYSAGKYIKQINFIPGISQLRDHYSKIPAPDLFSFLFIDFMVQIKGKNILPELLRNSRFYSGDEIDKKWKSFIEKNYY